MMKDLRNKSHCESRAQGFKRYMEYLRKKDPFLADAAIAMYEYVTDKWHGFLPTKEQADAVNRFFKASHCDWEPDEDIRSHNIMIRHRIAAGNRLALDLFAHMDNREFCEARDTIEEIAKDPEYHFPERTGLRR